MTDLTLTEAAAVVGVTPRQLRHAVVTGKLRARTVGRAYVVARADLDAWQPPAPGASLDAYWRARGKRGGASMGYSGADGEGTPAPAGPTYAPALVRMRDGSTTPAEVILDGSGAPDEVIDFGLFRARWRSKANGAFLYDEV